MGSAAAACNALPQLAEEGDAANIATVTSWLKHKFGDVRRAAWDAGTMAGLNMMPNAQQLQSHMALTERAVGA